MNDKLNIFKLGDISEIFAGGDKPKDFSLTKNSDYNIPVYANGETNLGLQGYTRKAKVVKPAVTVSARGTIGFSVLRKEPFVPIVRLLTLIPDSTKLDVIYLYYYLTFNRQAGIGSSQAQLTVPDISNRTIFLPKIEQQILISKVLSSIDSKIELNNKINSELEKMAKTLYDYWFVQFDFPDENGKPYKSSGGKMVWSDDLKREIPVGWEVTKMSEWVNIDKSGDWGKEKQEGNYTKKVTCIRGSDINGLNGINQFNPPIRYILENNSFKILKSHDLIIEISGGSPTQSTGRLAFITDSTLKRSQNPLICSNFCKPLSIKNKKYFYNFVYYWNSLYDNGIFFGYEGKTSGIKNLLLDSFLNSYYTVLPSEKIVDNFYNVIENIQEKKQTVLCENQKLVELRDFLLPMLMNGQVSVG